MKWTRLFLISFLITNVEGQNLMVDPGFSNVEFFFGSYPSLGHHRVGHLNHWTVEENSTRRIHTLLHQNGYSAEMRPGGLHPSVLTGLGMPYFNFYINDVLWDPEGGASFLVGQMIAPLEQDTVYCFEAHFRLASRYVGWPYGYEWGAHSLDSLGVLFSDTNDMGTRKPYAVGIRPHIVNQTGIITDTMWHKMQGTYRAQGNERYAIIGVFNPLEANMVRVSNFDSPQFGNHFYSFVDAVFLYNCRDTIFEATLRPDTLVCPNEPLPLHARWSGFKLEDTVVAYTWYHNDVLLPDTDSVLLATQAGTYRVVVTINHRFRAEARVKVDFYPEEPDTALIPPEITLCLDQQELLFLPDIPYTTYQWTSGETTRRYRIFQPGHFGVTATSPCWERTDATEVIYENCNSIWIPNAFTPDGDGINDVFEIRGAKFPVKLWIFDRWGNVVYQSEDYQNDWAGIYPNGQPAPGGVYTYKVSWRRSAHGGERDLFGTITILR
jgi:gliding motility-associated-like protein